MTSQPPAAPDPYGQRPSHQGYPQAGYPLVPPPGYATAPPIGQDPETGEPVTSDQKTQAVLAQALSLVGGFLVGLIFLLTSGKRSSFVRAHATAALNLALTQVIVVVGHLVLFLGAMFIGAAVASNSEDGSAGTPAIIVGILAFGVPLVLLAFGIASVVLLIMGAMRASRLQPPPRPRFVLRLVKDRSRRG